MNPPACPTCGETKGYERHIAETATTHMIVQAETASAAERLLHNSTSPWRCLNCHQQVRSWDAENHINHVFRRNGGLL